MVVNEALLTAVRGYDRNAAQLGDTVFTNAVKTALADAVLKFNLAPDLFVDVARLPSNVTNLTTLITYLGTIQEKLAAKDNKVKNEEWEVAKSGELRLYKLYVCCIHGLNGYINQSGANAPSFAVSAAVFAAGACTYARTHVPDDFGEGAGKLWEKTFATSAKRTVKVMVSLIYLISQEPAAATTGGQPPAGGGN